MKKLISILILLVASTLTAYADYFIKDGNGALQSIKAGSVSGTILPYSSLVNSSGVPIGVAGNPMVFDLRGINGTAPGAANPLYIAPATGVSFNVVCTSGCSGGGGGGGTSSNFGSAFPTAGTAIGISDGTNMLALRGDNTNGLWVNVKTSVPLAVTGTFWQTTQPVSIAGTIPVSGPLTDGQLRASAVPVSLSSTTVTGSVAVTGTFWQATQPVSIASSVSITGTVTANAGTNLNTSLLALESGGNIASLVSQIGAVTASPVANTIADRLKVINTTLGTPFQAGASIGNTSFGISGTLPAFAATPTFNLGTLNGAATAANQTNASQKTQIVDGSGNVIASTSNNLNVQCANCSGSGVSTADQASFVAGTSLFAGSGGFFQTTATSNPLTNGQQGMFQMTANRAGFVNLRNASGTEIGTASAPIRTDPTGTTPQPVSGTVSFSNTTIAVTQPTASSLNATVIGTGTFAVQAAQSGTWNVSSITTLPSLVAGSAVIGKVGIDQTTPGTTNLVALAANQSVNQTQINGVTVLAGNGVSGTGSQRVNIASDNTPFTVNPTSATAPVSTMNNSSAGAGVTAANAFVFDDVSPTAITENNFGYARISANRNQYQTLRDAAGNERGQNVNANNAALVAIDQTTAGGNVVTTTVLTSTTTAVGSTITTGGTFQTALASSGSRKNCALQNTSVRLMYVFLGTLGSATLTNSFQISPGQFFYCAAPNGVVATDNINITTATTGDTYVLTNQ